MVRVCLFLFVFTTLCCMSVSSDGHSAALASPVSFFRVSSLNLARRLIFLNPQIGGRKGNPGFQIRISSKGLRYANTVAGNLLNSEIRRAKIPDVHQDIKRGYAKARNMRISEFQPPTYSFTVTAPNRLGWSTRGGKITVKGDWKVKKRIWPITIRKSGTFKATAKDVRLSISAAFRNSNGKPRLENVRCNARVGSLSLELKGGFLGWILNLFRGKIARRLKPLLERETCKQAKKFVENDVNGKLRTFPMKQRIGHGFELDYSLTSDPRMSGGAILSAHNGEIKYTNSRKPLTFYPHGMQVSSSNSKMVYFYGSDYILNSFLSYANQYGVMAYTINDKTLPSVAKYLSTSCNHPNICLGMVFPELKKKHPNSKGSIQAETTTDPTVLFRTGNTTVRAVGKISLYLQAPGSRAVRILSSNVSLSANLVPRVTSDLRKVFGTMKINTLRVYGVNSTIANLTDEKLQGLVSIVTPILEAQANKYFRKGLAIPVTRGVRLRKVGLRLLPRTLELSADVTYSG